jgi:hypothetical protein
MSSNTGFLGVANSLRNQAAPEIPVCVPEPVLFRHPRPAADCFLYIEFQCV